MNIFLQGVDCYSNCYHWCPTVFISCNNTVIPNDNLLVEFKQGVAVSLYQARGKVIGCDFSSYIDIRM